MNLWSSLWHIPTYMYIRVHHQLVLTVFAAVKVVQAAHIQTGVHVHCMCTVTPSCVIEHMHACTCRYARWNALQSTLWGCWECFIVWNQAIPSLEASLGCTLWAAVYGIVVLLVIHTVRATSQGPSGHILCTHVHVYGVHLYTLIYHFSSHFPL